MLLKGRCPRCGGNLQYEKELRGYRIICLLCSREVGEKVILLKPRNRSPKVRGETV